MSRGRVLSKIGGLTQTISGISTFVGVSTFKSDVRIHGNIVIDGSTTFNTALENSSLANSTVSFGGVTVALGAADATPALDLSDATNYPTSSLSGTITNAQLAGSIANSKLANSTVSFGGISLALGASDATPAFDLSDATGYPTSSLTGTITNAQLAGSIANAKLANSTVSFGGISLALGASDATPAFDLSDATGYPTSSLTGTITNAQLAGSIVASKLAGSIGNSLLSNSTVSFGGISLALGGTDATPAFDLSDATNYPTSSLSGTITNAQLAGSIANSKLANSTITVSDGSNSTATALGGTITFAGTGNEVDVAESSGTVTIGLPNNVTIANNLTVTGNLQVDGSTTTINTSTMTVEDKNIEIAKGAANDAAADGAGITVDSGDGDKTWNWVDATDSWTSSENIDLASGKVLKSNTATILSSTTLGSSVVNSSLTSLGTISTGVWQGTAIANAYLANSTMSVGGVTLTLGATDATPAFNLSDATNYPTSSLSGTITNAQLAGSIASAKLANTGVSAGTVGSSTAIPIITVNAQGQITSTSTTAIDSTTIENGTASVAVANNGPITSTGNHDFTAGIDVTGDITVSGTVDGVDIAALNTTVGNITTDLVSDSSPQLGANLDVNGNSIVSTSNGNIAITPNGSGKVVIDGISHPTSDGANGQVLTTNGAGALSFQSVNQLSGSGIEDIVDDTSPQLGGNLDVNGKDIVSVSNGDIEFSPNGTGAVVFKGVTSNGGNGAGRFKLNCENNSHGITIQGPPHSAGADYTLTLPDDDGSSGQALITDGSGALSWTTITGATNLGTSTATGSVTITSSTGNNTTISEASSSAAGVMSVAHHDKLDGIASGATNVTNNNQLTNGAGYITATLTNEQVEDIIGGMLSGNTESGITVTYQDSDGTIDFAVASQTDENFTTADHAKLDGIEAGATADQTGAEIKSLYEAESDTNAFTDALASKLSGIEASATADQTAAEIRTLVDSATDSNVLTDALLSKLNGIESGATADQTDEEIQDIVGAMLTGNTESGITVTYQDTDGTIDFTVASQTDENFTTADHAKLDGIEAGATADQSDAEIKTAYENNSDTNALTDALLSKLNGIESGATADQTSEEIQDIVGAMLTGNTESGITVTYQDSDGTIDFSVASQTDENFTTADHAKLDGIEAGATADQSDEEIQDIVGAMLTGNTESGITVTYQDDDGTIDFSVASQTDENFTTADHSKLDGIEENATADQTASEILTLLKTVDGSGSGLDADTLDGISSASFLRSDTSDTFTGTLTVSGAAAVDNLSLNGNTVTTSSGNLTIDSAGGTTTVADNLAVSGNLTVNGTTTTVNATTVNIADKNIQVATGSADDSEADGGGITIDSGDGDKTFQFEATGDNFGSSENMNLADGKVYKIDNTSILSATTLGSSVTGSSLTSLGTISTGVWQGTAIANAYLANSTMSVGGVTLTLGGTDATPAFDLSDATNYPTSSLSGTITNAQLAGSIAASKLAGSIGNAKLSNSSVSYGGVSLSLGGSDATPAFDLSDATDYPTSSLVGTITNAQLAGSIASSKLADTGVSAASYGSASAIPIITVNAQGQITALSTASVSIDATQITEGNTSMSVDDSGTGSIIAAIDGSTLATFAAAGITLSSGAFVGNLTGNVTGNTSGSSGSCTGNSATATKLANARTIAGVSFDGSANISLNNNAITNGAGYITSSGTSAACSGNSATATLATNSTITANNSTDETVYLVFVDGATGTQGLESDTGLSYNPSSGNLTATRFVGAVTGNVTGNASGSSGSCTGNAATATALANARTIAGVSFDGTANISLNNNAITNGAGYITSSGTSAACSGNSATATVASNSTITANNSTNETVYPVFVDGATGTQGLESDTGLSYNPSSGNLTSTRFVGALTGNVTGNTSGSSGSCTGNAATATKLATARTIAGVSFDGSGNISLNNANITNGAGYVTQNTQLSDEQVQDIVGAMLTGNTESGITVTYQDSDGTIDFSVADQTESASAILTKIKTVDGSGSGLDADTLDGINSGSFLRSDTADTMTATLTARTIVPQSDSSYNLGSDSVRWSNIYGDNIRTGDLHLSNEHLGGNEVDGTWGHYQIQEGEDDLFLFNKRSGKKYRFLLQQV